VGDCAITSGAQKKIANKLIAANCAARPRFVFSVAFIRLLQLLSQFLCGGGDAFPGAAHTANRAPEVDALHFDLINRFGAFRFQIVQAADFGLRLSHLLFQFGDLKRKPFKITILLRAVVTILQPFQFFLLSFEVDLKLRSFVGGNLMIVFQPLEDVCPEGAVR
jgi:hypothetical protein